jgi:hypothetical protein
LPARRPPLQSQSQIGTKREHWQIIIPDFLSRAATRSNHAISIRFVDRRSQPGLAPRPGRNPSRIEDPWYDADHQVRRVRTDGTIRWRGRLIFISEALIGEQVGLTEVDDDRWLVRFADLDIGLIDATTKNFRRFTAARPGRREPKTNRDSVNHVPGL